MEYETRAPKVVQSNTGSAGFITWKLDYTSLFSLKGFFLSQLSGIPICIFYLDKGEKLLAVITSPQLFQTLVISLPGFPTNLDQTGLLIYKNRMKFKKIKIKE